MTAPSPGNDSDWVQQGVVSSLPGRPLPARTPARIRVESLEPTVTGGYPVKRTVGDTLTVGADVIRDGHEVLRAAARWRRPGSSRWEETPMRHVDADAAGVHWEADLPLDAIGRWTWTVRAWADAPASWREEVSRKAAAGQEDLSGELLEGAALLSAVARRATGADRNRLVDAAATVADPLVPTLTRVAAALDPEIAEICDRYPDQKVAVSPDRALEVQVDPVLARFGSWYELFPRSWGGLAGVRQRLPAIAELGLRRPLPAADPPHRAHQPQGPEQRARGRVRTTRAAPGPSATPPAGTPRSTPSWAPSTTCGALVTDARGLGLEVALDFAIQCSADHPWLTEHPEWFFRRPDGTLKYAENPPKKYQDIYNVDFDCDDWQGLWQALLDVVRFWVEAGVRVFRVDNPHTKPITFWEWLIGSIHDSHPEVIFLAEAFTKRKMMQELAKVGFSQSYTYFTWKSSRWELTEYVSELCATRGAASTSGPTSS